MRVTLLMVTGLVTAGPLSAQSDYLVFVASEAVDQIALVRYGAQGAHVERRIDVGMMPTDPDGPHGLAVSPDGRFLFVTTAHGAPYGFLWKYDAVTGRLAGRVELGNFPATLAVTPDGSFAYVVNFNLHGDMVPSSVSVVATDELLEVARIRTCTMPHGSRINARGTLQYSACMMDDLLVEIDTRRFGVARHFMLAAGREHGMAGTPQAEHGTGGAGGHQPQCSPTWAQPSADGAVVFVACHKSNEIVEIDAATWTVRRRLGAGEGVYNLAVTGDGRLLIATNKRGQSVSVYQIASGKELARLSTLRPVVHGVVVSPDDRYAFISVEGIGAAPGTVEVVDLRRLETAARVDVGPMAGGIAFWRMDP